jgi:L-aspartate oxidase
MQKKVDFIVVGSGIAGLHSALVLASHGNVLLVTKKTLAAAATSFAQGGIAAVTDKQDSLTAHEEETITVGYKHNNKKAVKHLVAEGKRAIEQLESYGLNFDKSRFLEAGHSYPRIFHATDFTGREIEQALIMQIKLQPSIEIWENTFALDLIIRQGRCIGLEVMKKHSILSVASRATVLATGGIGQLYQWTTNPKVATGDGIAMAYRAGAQTADMEFVQFHPTALQSNDSPLFLLSETLRGEGAYLVDAKGMRFMTEIHPDAELAPRDIVARAIFQRQQTGLVYLDIRHIHKATLMKRFPNIYKGLKKRGFDLSTDLIPITPAAHFLCGGIKTDLYGRTSIKNLFAYGETAATGVHGANRLASNSLLEGAVFPQQIVSCLQELPESIPSVPVSHRMYTKSIGYKAFIMKLQSLIWNYVGIERTAQGLFYASRQLAAMNEEIGHIQALNEQTQELKNMISTAMLITKAASRRKESLGTHYMQSYL